MKTIEMSQGTTYFTTIDQFTRWPEAIPMVDATALSCARALLNIWLSRFGVPTEITSDRVRQVTSGLWTEFGKVLGTRPQHSFHPQSNGIVERFHRQLKASLKARLQVPSWRDKLPIVLRGIRSAPRGFGVHIGRTRLRNNIASSW